MKISKTYHMNIVIQGMNKTNMTAENRQISDNTPNAIQLQIDFADIEILGDFWNIRRLPGFHWRLYYHNAPGAGVIFRDQRRIPLLPEFVYLLPPSQELGSYTAPNAQPEQTFINFALDGCLFNAHEDFYAVPADSVLKDLLEKMRGELKRFGATPVSQLYATAVAALALTQCREMLETALNDTRINAVCRLMKEAPEHQWSNAELAARFGFAVNAFIRRFREIVGLAPHQYLQHLRYSLAARLLETTNLSIAEIAERVGINDQFHFSREFKRFHERSPSAHRQKMTRANHPEN